MAWYLEHHHSGEKIALIEGSNSVGRTPRSKIQLDSNYCSRAHCNIVLSPTGTVKIVDFSTNGIFVAEECFVNMDINIAEGVKFGIGCWPFENTTDAHKMPVFFLRKEHPPEPITQPVSEPTFLPIAEPAVNQSIPRTDAHQAVEPIGQSIGGTTDRPLAEINLISDDDDSRGPTNLPKNARRDSTTLGRDGLENYLPMLVKMEVDEAFEPPEFLPAEKATNGEPLPGPSVRTKIPVILDVQFLPSKNNATSTTSTVQNNDANSNELRNMQEKESLASTIPSTSSNHNQAVEEMEIDMILSQSILLEIKQEVADLEYEQSFESKIKLEPCDEANVGDRAKGGVDNTSPIYIIDDDDDDDAEYDDHESEMAFNNWANKLSQSFTSQTPMVTVHAQPSTSHTDENASKVQSKMEMDELSRQMRRSLSLEDVRPKHTKERQQDVKEKIQERQRETRQSAKSKTKYKDFDFLAKQDSNDSFESNDLDDSRETKRGKKHKLHTPEPVPSTSRASTIDMQPEAKRKRPLVIDAPVLRTGRGKLRGHSASSLSTSSSLRNDIERKLQNARHSDHEKQMKDKWRQKPSLERQEEKIRLQNLQEHRKVLLKELAAEQAEKRQCTSSDDNKTIKKAKVKVTEKTRGAFLADALETAKVDVHSKRIPKLRSSLDQSKSTENESCVANETPRIRSCSVAIRRESTTNPISTEKPQKSSKTTNGKDSCFSVKKKSPRTKKKSVRFADKPEIRYFQIEDESNLGRKVDCKDAPMSSVLLASIQQRTREYTIDHSDVIINDILGWDPIWLATDKQKVNGSNHMLMPLVQQYRTFDEFTNIIMPLFKLELWCSIDQDYKRRLSIQFTPFDVTQFFSNRRGNFIYHCEANTRSIRDKINFTLQELCVIQVQTRGQNVKVFGIINSTRFYALTSTQEALSIYVEIKGNPKYKSILQKATKIHIKPLTNLRVEVGIYNAIRNLRFSPLGKSILNPFELLQSNRLNTSKIQYKGYNELNSNQRNILLEAYERCIDSEKTNNLFLIEGPPGTGKSRIITNLALQSLYGYEVRGASRRKKILICAQSNAAIDIIVLKLLDIRRKMDRDKFNLVRYGVYDRIHPSARCVSLRALVQSQLRNEQSDTNRSVLKNEKKLLETQIESLSKQANVNNVALDELQKKKEKIAWIDKTLASEITSSGMEKHYPKFLVGADIVCTTLSSCINLLNYVKKFDICIIDEATQCAEPYTLIPLQFGISSLILVGDTQQLPATVLSVEANEREFGRSLFTRIQKCLDGQKNCPIQMLTTQYRMHPEISAWSNMYFYKNSVCNDESTNSSNSLIKPYAVLSLEYNQDNEQEPGKIINVNEAKFVVELLTKLVEMMSPDYFTYGIITPYTHHKDYLQQKINEAGIQKILVNTIDSYQGKEKDVIIISSVRTKGIGFLGNSQRLNVALTRAKKCLFVCGNFTSLKREHAWKSLLDNAKRRDLLYHIKPNDVNNFETGVMRHLRINIAAVANTNNSNNKAK